MRFALPAILLMAAACLAIAACGSEAAGPGHGAQAALPAGPAPPTPDNTPIGELRTPAGLVLKLAETPAAVTPAPTPSPAAEPAKPAS